MANVAALESRPLWAVRVAAVGARAILAGCVAASLYGVAATIGWIWAGALPDALGQIALAGPVVFTAAAAVRGFGGLLYTGRRSPAAAVVTDAGICVAALALIALVGSLHDGSGSALYGVLVIAPFVIASAITVSVLVEIVARRLWLIWGAVALAGITGIVALGVYALSFSP